MLEENEEEEEETGRSRENIYTRAPKPKMQCRAVVLLALFAVLGQPNMLPECMYEPVLGVDKGIVSRDGAGSVVSNR